MPVRCGAMDTCYGRAQGNVLITSCCKIPKAPGDGGGGGGRCGVNGLVGGSIVNACMYVVGK